MSDPVTRLNAVLEGRYRIERELRAGGMAIERAADLDSIEAALERDPKFTDALEEARGRGVQILGRRTRISLDQTVLGGPSPVR